MKPIKLLTAIILFAAITNASAQNTFWVTKAGDDNNNCTNATDDACLTIQKGVSLLQAGDTLNIGAGIYTDDGGNSAYSPPDNNGGWFDNNPDSSNVYIAVNGEPGNLITIQATPGSEGQVTIDGEFQRVPVHIATRDYIRITGFNIINGRGRAIATWGQVPNEVADTSLLSIGVVIENNRIINTIGDFGTNTNAISMWSTQDWIVRNNYIDNVIEVDAGTTNFNRFGTAIMAYGTINALIEHNQIKNVAHGVFWKDHFITDLATRGLVNESEIRYNKIQATSAPVNIGIRATNSPEAGDNYIHHNIFYGHGSNEEGGVSVAMASAYAQSGDVRIEHNLIDGETINNSRGIGVDASRNITVKGNIIIRTKVNMQYTARDTRVALGKKPVLDFSNYNIYNNFERIVGVDVYGSASQWFSTLGSWQTALNSQFASLNFDNPDANSITANPTDLFEDLDDKNYIYKAGSPAIGMMPDGSNAGPYQFGDEIIGLLPQWPGVTPSYLIFTNGFE